MAELIAKTYSEALFDLAQEEQKRDALYEEIMVFLEALDESRELFQVMNHPGIPKEEKKQLIESILKETVSDTLTGFVILLVNNGRFSDMKEIFRYFIYQVKESKGIGTAWVTTAVELTDEQKQQVVDKLKDTTAYQSFEMHYIVEKEVIGGMVIRINDRIVDSSIRTKLEDIARKLKEIQLV